jgi:hypothetical protein
MTHIIHVNRNLIAANAKDGGNRPVYKVGDRYAQEVEILGPSRLVYNGKQLSCGARAWLETDAEIILTGECRYKDIE